MPGLRPPSLRDLARKPVADALRRATSRPKPKPRRRGKDPDEGGIPAEPNRPLTLSGGAAAALEFDED